MPNTIPLIYKMKYITGSRDTDYKTFNYLDDVSLAKLFSTSKRFLNCDLYFQFRLQHYFSADIVNYKPADSSYKQQYFDLVKALYFNYDYMNPIYRIDLMIWTHDQYGWSPNLSDWIKMVANTNLETVKFAAHKFNLSEYLRRHSFYNINLLDSAIVGGQLETAQWLNQLLDLKPTTNGLKETAKNAHLHVINWIYKTFNLLPELDNYPLPVVKWLLSGGTEITSIDNAKFLSSMFKSFEKTALAGCYISNNPELCSWMLENDLVLVNNTMIDYAFATNKDYANRLMEKYKINPTSGAVHIALLENNVEALKILVDTYRWRELYFSSITSSKCENFDALQYIYRTGVMKPSNTRHADQAITYWHLSILKYLYQEYQMLPDTIHVTDVISRLNYCSTNCTKKITAVISWLIDLKYSFHNSQACLDKLITVGELKLCQLFVQYTKLKPRTECVAECLTKGNFPVWNWLKTSTTD